MRTLRRFAHRLVPAVWRETVVRDLTDEAARRRRPAFWRDLWVAWQASRIGVAFRWREMRAARGPVARWSVSGGADRLRVDLRHTWRALRARPGASLGTALVLIVGISLTATIFALTDPLLLRPLPYRDPARLVIIQLKMSQGSSSSSVEIGPDVPTLADWRRRADLFEDVAAIGGGLERLRLTTPGGAASLRGWTVSANFLSFLGAETHASVAPRPALAGAPRPLVVSETTARVRLGLTDAGMTTTLRAGDALVTVVPILAEGFVFPLPQRALRPNALIPVDFGAVIWRDGRGLNQITALARLQRGVSPMAVQTALGAGVTSSGFRVAVQPLASYLSADIRPLALGALAAGLMIVFVCTANVMNLVVARGMYRTRDFATRRAVGASPMDLLRLVVLELAAIVGTAAAASLLLARVSMDAIANLMPANYAALGEPAVTVRVVVFVAALTIAIVLACAIPVWLSTRSAMVSGPAAMQPGETRAMRRGRFLLAAGQTSVAMVLLVGATFLARSYANLWTQATGFARETRLVSVSYPDSTSSSRMEDTITATTAALRHVVGVTDVAVALSVGSLVDGYGGAGGPTIRAGGQAFMMMPSQVTPEYFAVVGTPIVAGRSIEATDRGWDAIVVNEALARRLWPGMPPGEVIGSPITGSGNPGRVVGVVQNTHDRALDIAPAPHLFKRLDSFIGPRRFSFAIRLAAGAPVPESALRRAVTTSDASVIVEAVDSVFGRLSESVRDRTFATLVLGAFAVGALGITGTGIFAVVAFVAARRTREIAIRVALGADAGAVRRLVVRDAVVATLAGCVAGLVASHWLGRTIESLLYGVQADAWTMPALATVGLVAVTAVAAWWPTRRALRIAPTLALRLE